MTALPIIPITKQTVAIKVTLSYKFNEKFTTERQLSTFGFVFDQATKQQRNRVEGNFKKKEPSLYVVKYLLIYCILAYKKIG